MTTTSGTTRPRRASTAWRVAGIVLLAGALHADFACARTISLLLLMDKPFIAFGPWLGVYYNLSDGTILDKTAEFLKVLERLGPAPGPLAKVAPADGSPAKIPMTSSRGCPGARAAVVADGNRLLYIANGDICAYVLDWTTGIATPVPGMPFRGGLFARSIARDRSGSYVYTANQDSNDVSGFAIDRETGVLTPVPGSPFPAGTEPLAVATDGTGRYVYVANSGSNGVTAYRIAIETGTLTPVPGSPFAAPDRAWALAADPTGRYLYAAGIGVQAYRIDGATGSLAPVGAAVPTGNHIAKGVAVDPTGRFAYVTWGSAQKSGVSAYAIGPAGGLTVAGQRVATGDSPLAVAVSPSGGSVYTANLLGGSISGFDADPATGALSPMAGSPFASRDNPTGLLAWGALPGASSWPAGERFGLPIAVEGGSPPYTFSIVAGALPAGLSLDSATGFVAGVPTAVGTATFTVHAADSTGSATSGVFTLVTRASAGTSAATAVEYYHADLDHYFVTHVADEIAKLDAGIVLKGWARTGKSIPVWTTAQASSSPVCRYYIPPGLGDSHFFGRGTVECDDTGRKNPSFILEDPAFVHMILPAAGVCPAGTIAVYRVFSNRRDANHRYTTDKATRDGMVAKGWLAEGDGPDLVVMCAPA